MTPANLARARAWIEHYFADAFGAAILANWPEAMDRACRALAAAVEAKGWDIAAQIRRVHMYGCDPQALSDVQVVWETDVGAIAREVEDAAPDIPPPAKTS